MHIKSTYGNIFMVCIILAALLLLSNLANAQDDNGFYCVVNKKNSIQSLNKIQLRNIMLGNTTTWQNNKKIQIVDFSVGQEIRKKFSSKFLKLTPNRVSMIRLKKTLTGKALAPKIFHNQEDMLDYISKNENAVGVVSSNTDLPEEIKVIYLEK